MTGECPNCHAVGSLEYQENKCIGFTGVIQKDYICGVCKFKGTEWYSFLYHTDSMGNRKKEKP